MTLWRTARTALAAAVLAAIPLAGCGGGNLVNTGPFDGGTGGNRFCVPAESPDSVFTAGGLWLIRNAGPTAVVDKVSLTHLRGLQVLEDYAVPGITQYGNLNGFPSLRLMPAGVQWSRRQSTDGARIAPTPHGQLVGLVLVVKLLGKNGSVDGLDVYYHTSGGQYHLHISNGLTLTTARTINNCPVP